MSATCIFKWTHGGTLRITGLTTGEPVNVYTAAGALVYHSIATSEEMDISLNAQGMYIIRNGGNTVRVVFN